MVLRNAAVMVLAALVSACGEREVPRPGHCLEDSDCTVARGFAPEQTQCSLETCPPGVADGTPEAAACVMTRFRCVIPSTMQPDGGDGGAGVDVLPGGDTGIPDAAGSCSVDQHCPAATPACVANRCVACRDNAQCAGSPNTPFCVANACVGCAAAPVNACALKSAATPACGPSGACVECTADSAAACMGAKPVCGSANTCIGCTTDAQCTSKPTASAPGVCMAHEDGRCATTEETEVVQNGDLQAAIDVAVVAGKKLVVVPANASVGAFAGPGKLSIIGKGATPPDVGGSTTKPALVVTGGDLYLRGVTLTASKGGLLVDGGTVEVVSTTVQQNLGALIASDVAWGGIRVQSVAPGKIAKFRNVSILNNAGPGMTCGVAVQGQGVLATGNNAPDVGTTCAVVNCLQASSTCGAAAE